MAIRFFDMFAGIGGFRSGLEAIGGYKCIGHCEIDKYANQAYNAIYEPKGEIFFEDARTINPKDLPYIDLICAGFPCQSFSIAGLRKGFDDDARGTLFFEIARIAAVKRPSFLLLENVPGVLSHDKGRTFATILNTLPYGEYNLFNLLALIAFAYCVIKIFFANIKRGGILLIQMAVGSLYMFSVPRGYSDGFNQWMKQVAAICLTAFMQTTLLYLGLLTFPGNMLLGLGIMLAANEVPRIAQQFGLDSSVKVNMMSVVHATTTAVNLTRSVARATGK